MAYKKLLALLSLIIIGSAFALSPVFMDSESTKNDIKSNEAAIFDITLINNQKVDDVFLITAPLSKWDVTFSDYIVTVPAKSSKKISVRLSPPMFSSEGNYAVFIKAQSTEKLDISNFVYLQVKINEIIIPESEEVSEITINEKVSDTFLKDTYSFTIENTGNILYSSEWLDVFSELQTLLLKSNLEYTSEAYGDDKRITWTYALEPGESITISYSVSYYPVLFSGTLFILAIALFGYYYLNKFSISKEIIKQKDTMMIKLLVKNRTNSEQTNVIVEDLIPKPMKLVKKFGTMAPAQIINEISVTKLVWKFESLAPREERILSYELRSEMYILGDIVLPEAKIVQKKSGKILTKVFSGKVKIVGR